MCFGCVFLTLVGSVVCTTRVCGALITHLHNSGNRYITQMEEIYEKSEIISLADTFIFIYFFSQYLLYSFFLTTYWPTRSINSVHLSKLLCSVFVRFSCTIDYHTLWLLSPDACNMHFSRKSVYRLEKN